VVILGAFSLVGVLGCEAPEVDDASPAACVECEIRFLDSIQLQAPDTVTFNGGGLVTVSRDSQGRHFVAPTFTPGAFAVFDQAGQFEQMVGRVGEGPGEFANPRWVAVGPGDSLWVHQNRAEDVSILDPELGFVRRTLMKTEVPSLEAAARLGDGAIAVGERVSITPDERESGVLGSGPGVAIVDVSGEVLSSFGQREPGRPATRLSAVTSVAQTPSFDAFWLWSHFDYRIERWSPDGTQLAVIEPDEPRFIDPDSDARGAVWAIMESEGVLWIHLRFAGPFRDEEAPQILQAVDIESGRVLAERSMALTPYLTPGGFVYFVEEDASGLNRISVMLLELREGG